MTKKNRVKTGLVQLYTGKGKGKTTAAIGQAIRAAGAGKKTAFFQFLKGGKFPVSEENILMKTEGIFYKRFEETTPFFDAAVEMDGLKMMVKNDIETVKEAIASGVYEMIILDEITHLIKLELAAEKTVIDMIKKASENVNFVLTGRGASKKLIDFSDLVTEMRAIKHPYKKGVKAAKGVEF